MKTSNALGSAFWLVPFVLSAIFIWCAIKLSKVDDGANLNSTSNLIRERVITDKVVTYRIDGVEYLSYQGEKYVFPPDKKILIEESVEDFNGVANKRIETSILFDEDEQEFIYEQKITARYYQIEKLKKKMVRHAAWSLLGAIILWPIGVILAIISFGLFVFWIDDIKETSRK